MLFWVNAATGITKDFDQLKTDIQSFNVSNALIDEADPYWGYVHLLKLLINKNPVVLADGSLGAVPETGKLNFLDSSGSWDQMLSVLKSDGLDVPIFMNTSGSTGKPKIIEQSLRLLTKNIVQKESLLHKKWLLTYHPYHMAGVQVFLQALFTNSTIVFFPREIIPQFPQVLTDYKVTHIAFTPTFFRQVAPFLSSPVGSVEAISLGGEKSSPDLLKSVRLQFPKARVRSIYATTEAGSLFTADGNGIFEVPTTIRSLVKSSDSGEMLLHRDLLAKGQLKETEWYATGDVINWISDSRFEIVARKSDFINVGGSKVNPYDVESVILKHPAVEQAVVKSRPNSVIGNAIIAEVVLRRDTADTTAVKSEILQLCKSQLKVWEVPQMIKVVNQFQETKTGKVVRL